MIIKSTASLCAAFSLIGLAVAAAEPTPAPASAPAPAPAPSAVRAPVNTALDREAITGRFRDWVGGLVTRDPAVIDKVVSRDFQTVTYGGRLVGRDGGGATAAEIKAVTTKDIDVRLYGDAAVVRALVSVIERRDGRIETIPLRITQTWIREAGEWRAVADQATRIEPSLPVPPVPPAPPALPAKAPTPVTVGAAAPNG